MDKVKILIVDDEDRIREMIKDYTSREGYEIDEAANGEEALDLFRLKEYTLVILDVMMPKIDGWTVCREIRKTSQIPVIMLTARGEEYDKLFGFELGVDDYMVKPFSPKELLARIKVIARRSGQNTKDRLKRDHYIYEGLRIDFDAKKVLVDGNTINLTPKNFDLLNFFVENQNRVFSREQLLNQVWGFDFYGEDRTVDTHVKMLRESLGDYRNLIVTVWGTGYKFEIGDRK